MLFYILGPEHRVHSDRRLVQDEQLRVLQQSRSQRHPAPLTSAVTHTHKDTKTQETGEEARRAEGATKVNLLPHS